MARLQKRKSFEMGIPAYAFTRASDIMMFTYAHAYYAVFTTRNISKAIKLFRKDFDIEDEYDIDSAMVCYQRVREKFLDEQRRAYISSEISNIYVRYVLDVMIWAWVTFMRKHVNPTFDIEQAVVMFGEHFNVEFTADDVIMHTRRYNDSQVGIDTLPTVPMEYNLK